MDLIFTNSNREDLGVLLDYELDLAFGADENDFECTVQASAHCCEAGSLLYMEGTEYGGIVDAIKSRNDTQEVIYLGRTWQGILNSKVIEPDSGAAYLTLSGEANSVIGSLINRMELSGLFKASSEASGLTIQGYQMNRYIKGYEGVVKMLESIGAKLMVKFSGGMVVLSAVVIHNYAQDDEFDSDLIDFQIKKKYKTVNHLICLGTGELENRMVIHLYADTEGNISQTQTQFGMDEFTEVYDYSNVESEDELLSGGMEKLKSLWEPDEMSIDFDDTSNAYDVGDIVGAFDNVTRISVSAVIRKKIVTIKNGQITISYKVGE